MKSCVSLFYFVSLIQLVPVPVECVRRLINIDYLGIGYDAIQGNPQSQLEDPGFRQSIFPLEYTKSTVTADGRYMIPDNTEAYQITSCGYQTSSEEVRDEHTYRQSLSVDAKLDGKVFFVPFSASAEYTRVHTGTYMHDMRYVATTARCNIYRANVKLQAMNRLSDDFIQAVKSLPLDDYGPYLHLISIYGTHYVSSVVMGAKMMVLSEFEQTVWNNLKRQNFDFAAAAEASFWVVNLKLDVKVTRQTQMESKFSSERSSYRAMYVGSRPPSDGRWETWLNNTEVSPYPIRYTLRPLVELLDIDYFSESDVATLRAKRARLNEAVMAWWRCYPECRIPVNMKLPVLAEEVKDDVHGVKVISCNPETVLLSCGLDNVDSAGPWDIDRYAVPINSTSCECKASRGDVRCVLWCTNAVEGFQIAKASKPDRNHSFGVSCPAGTQVLGCHSKRLESSVSARRDQWQTNNGTSCLCYDTVNAECIATCAADIRNHHILHSNGTGLVTTSCPQGTMVLGCGTASPMNGQSRRRAAVVAMRTSCRCYDDYQVTCYAVCGLLMAESSYPQTRLQVARQTSSASRVCCESQLETTILFALGLVIILSKHD